MYRKILLGAGVGAAVVGIGGAAMAVSPGLLSDPSTTGGKHHHDRGVVAAKRLAHGQFVVKGKDGKYVTEDIANGDVTAVSATSVTVKTGDGTSVSFTVNKDTKVVLRAKGQKPTSTTISKAAKGTHVMVLGQGTGTPVATRVVVITG